MNIIKTIILRVLLIKRLTMTRKRYNIKKNVNFKFDIHDVINSVCLQSVERGGADCRYLFYRNHTWLFLQTHHRGAVNIDLTRRRRVRDSLCGSLIGRTYFIPPTERKTNAANSDFAC